MQSLLNRQQQAITDMRLPEDAYTSRWNVILTVTTEDGRRMLGTTQVIYLNPQSYYAQPAITIIGPAF
jgi:hypothetical protein